MPVLCYVYNNMYDVQHVSCKVGNHNILRLMCGESNIHVRHWAHKQHINVCILTCCAAGQTSCNNNCTSMALSVNSTIITTATMIVFSASRYG